MLTLHCLGDLRLERNGLPELHSRRKPLALLAFLARSGSRPATRDELADMFWGETGEANARKSLRQCLSELRPVVGDGMIETAGGLVLNAAIVGSDVQQFEEACAREQWSVAVDGWTGEFIPDGEHLGSESWRTWLERERTALRRRLGIACHRQTTAAEEQGAWLEVVRVAARWRTLLPDDARAWSREIHALQSSGRLAEALARHGEAEEHFLRTLEVAMPDELGKLGRVLTRLRDGAGTPGPRLLTPDLVGRGEVLTQLLQARLEAQAKSTARGRSVAIVAAEGLGKTRLLRDFARQARERGGIVIEAVALPIERERSLALCRTVLGRLASEPSLAGCPPESLAILARVAPEIREAFRHLPAAPDADRQAVVEAFSRAIAEVVSVTPVVLTLDDFPEADKDSIAVLSPVILRPPAGLLVIAAGRPESWRASDDVSQLLDAIKADGSPSLEPLDGHDIRAMLSSMAPIAATDLDRLVPEFHALSGGNPGLVASLITHAVVSGALARRESGQWGGVPAAPAAPRVPTDVDERWRARYARLDQDAGRAADALAVMGAGQPASFVDLSVWEQVSGLDPSRFRGAVDSLVTPRILDIAGTGARFTSEMHRLVTYQAIAPRVRQVLHGRAATALQRQPGRDRQAIALHRAASGRPRPRVAVAAMAAALTVLVAAAWFAWRPEPRVTPGSPVVLVDFENLTGDSTFDRTLQLAASVALQQSRQITVFPRTRVRETLQLMQRPGADSLFDEALGREIALRDNVPRVIAFALGSVDSAYVLTGRVIEPSTGRDLFAGTERASSRADVLQALDRLVRQVRRAVGESADSVRDYGLPLPRVTTASLPALQAYATGLAFWSKREFATAHSYYLRAVALDSTFALAWVALAEMNMQATNNRPAADSALARAAALTDHLTEREKLRLEMAFALSRGDFETGVRLSGRLAERFPERDTWYNYGTALLRARRCGEAITALERSSALDPRMTNAYINIATCQQFLGDYAAAIQSYTRAQRTDSIAVYSNAINHEFGVALVRAGLVDSAQRVFSRMTERPLASDRQFGHRSLGYLAAYRGRYRDAATHFSTAAVQAREGHVSISEFRNRVLQAEHMMSLADARGMREALDSAWAAGRRQYLAPHYAMVAGIAYARAGQLPRASAMLDTIERYARRDASAEQSAKQILVAHIALARGSPAAARAALLLATDTTRTDYVLAALVDVFAAANRTDSAYEAATQLAARAPFGTEAQDAWLRGLVRRGQLAEQVGRYDVARRSYALVDSLWSQADAELQSARDAKRGIERLLRDSAVARPVVPRR